MVSVGQSSRDGEPPNKKNKKPSINHGVLIRKIIYTYMGDHKKKLICAAESCSKNFSEYARLHPYCTGPTVAK